MSVGAIRAGRALVEIFADSSGLSRGLATAQGKLARFASSLRRFGAAQVALGSAIAVPLGIATTLYAQIEQRLNTVRALTGATAGQMAQLSAAVRQIGVESGLAFTVIADAMGDLARAGVAVADLDAATRAISSFARAAGVEMADAANIAVQVLTQFGLGMDQITRVTDVLQEMANATVSTVENLADGFRYAGQSANLFGLSLEQAAAAIATLQQTGLSASTAGTALNQFLLQMVQNLGKLEGAIGNLRGADGEFLPLEQILQKLMDFVAGMPGPERLQFLNEMFDVRGMRGAEGLLQNIELWQQLTAAAENSMGATQRKAQEMAKAFVVAFEKMRNEVVMLGFAIGEALDGELRGWFQIIGGIARGLADFVSANKEAVVSTLRLAAGLIASGAAMFSLGMSIQLALFSFEGILKAVSLVLSPLKMLASASMFAASAVAGIGASAISIVTPIARATAAMARFGAARAFDVLLFSGELLLRTMTGLGRALLSILPIIAYAGTAAFAAGSAFAGFAVGALGTLSVVGVFVAGFAALFTVLTTLSAALGVAEGAVGLVANALDYAARGMVSFGRAAGSGAMKVFAGVAARSAEVWPEMYRSAVASWNGIVAAFKSGDLGAAWGIFVAEARAAFAQVMIIIGPFVDDAVDLMSQIGTALMNSLRYAYDAVAPLLSGLGEIASGIFSRLVQSGADAASALGINFGLLGDIAEEAGNRIYDALSAGDIVQAWAAAATAIRKIMIQISSWWDQHVGQKVRLFAQEFGTWGRRSEIRDQAAAAGGLGRGVVEQIFDAQSVDEVDRLLARWADHMNDAEEAAAKLAAELRKEELRGAQVMTPEERAADMQRQLDEAEADYQADAEARKERREKAARDRRRAADEAAATAEQRAAAAQEPAMNAKIESDIASATTQEELGAAQDEIDARRRRRETSERAAFGGDGPTAVRDDLAKQKAGREFARLWVTGRNLDLLGTDDADLVNGKAEREFLRQRRSQAIKDIDASGSEEEARRILAANYEEEADYYERLMDDSSLSDEKRKKAERLRDVRREQAAQATEVADKARDRAINAKAEDDAARAGKSRELRADAAEARRNGDEKAAAAAERLADSLDQALDSQEEADLQRDLDARREELQRQQELRKKAQEGGERGGKEAGERRLDSIGGFMNKGFDRLGFGPNLSDNHQKRAADAAVAMLDIMRRNEGNAGVFV